MSVRDVQRSTVNVARSLHALVQHRITTTAVCAPGSTPRAARPIAAGSQGRIRITSAALPGKLGGGLHGGVEQVNVMLGLPTPQRSAV